MRRKPSAGNPRGFSAIRRGKPSPYLCGGSRSSVRAKGTLRFVCEAHSTTRPAPKLKSVGVQPFGFGKGWSPSQGRNSASSKEKFADIKRNKTNSHNTERTKAANKKSRMQKRKADHHSLHSQKRSVDPQSCMRRIDRKQPTVGRLCIGQPPTGGGRSLDLRYPQNKGI